MAKKAASSKKKGQQSPLRAKITIGVIGFILSIALHEGFHLLIHFHQIVGIRFFPNFYTIAELVIDIPYDYDLASEEFVAYAISATVLLGTAALIARLSDCGDTRSANQILFPENFTKPKKTRRKK